MTLSSVNTRWRKRALGMLAASAALASLVIAAPQVAHADPLSPNTGARVTTSGTPSAGAGGDVFYVNASTGNDSNTGLTTGQAWRTLSKVNSTAFGPGDVIAFQRGQTFTGSAWLNDAGASNNPIVVTAYGSGAQPILTNPGQWNMLVLDAAYLQVKNLAFDDGAVFDNANLAGITGPKYEQSGAVAITGNGSNALVQDSTFTDVGVGVKTYGANSVVEHNTFKDLRIAFRGMDSGSETSYGALGVSVNNSGVRVSYNDFINCRSTDSPYGADGGAVEIEGFLYNKDNITIDHNYSRGSQGFLEVTETSSSHVDVIYNVSDDYQQMVAWDTTTDPTDYYVANNTIVRRNNSSNSKMFDWWYYREWGPAPADDWATITNNIFYLPYTTVFGNYVFPHDHNLYGGTGAPVGSTLGVGDMIAAPQFVNYGTGDLRLPVTSPAVDNGTTAASVTDLDGATTNVGQGVDIGAFEHHTPAGGAASIVNDGSFETQTSITTSSSPWYKAGPLSYGVDVAAGKSHTGSDNGWIASTTSTSWGALHQTVAVTTNSTYRLTVWVRNSGNIDNAWLGVKTPGGTVISEIRSGKAPTTYSRYVVTFTTGANTSVVIHVGYWAPGATAWVQVDDVGLQKL
ncbi:MAG: hypothetical protein JWP85_2012 [Rhodoglobus sp.]|nr:hypothetical protein [Rhodoglobus sp.]